MKLLAIDSATEAASCAVMDDNKLLGEITFNYKKQHSVIIMNIIDYLLKNLKISIDDLDGFVVSKGPGSFTGLRIGMAVVKGLSEGSKKPFVSISSLDTMAYSLAYTSGIICPIIDALRNNVYTAIYKFENTNFNKISDYMAISVDDLIKVLKDYNLPVTFIGDAVPKFKETFEAELNKVNFAPGHLNLVKASGLCELGMNLMREGKFDNPLSSAPIYLRKSQAEREYESRTGRSIDE
ncbi:MULTISPECIES: tRNA (adenosine(37)-N6)-threonylcarbamoyltransferase complex dimerization subunit type 1 TsaB [Clostridium]|uniref:tRNA (adenosine(37)-N6)-threonylcarbamoyltransferase complex dimerization subunit type 1 TsaB n=1 Tax=Clostridium TaxID=1485 RepID=UPI00069EA124|nr:MULTISPECIES: tRNA (adenosine(37)-N6)-threonylcarbamoyltransferase complex dimerization subunit type 1 TsaB [Clostridium]KOF57050.1 glycoprotease [Clostridium sp. DMHC 10]MCD2347021.1 tRNA (adenosine(37)-N6)-threonylcarbamoyltransferase complex dimerization subunit type 1 TsaB [Clostridium guangxiense]